MSKLPDIKTKFPDWYQEVVYQAQLAEQSPVRGCIVIRPYGNAIWESIKTIMDQKIKATGAQNAIFPLLIPESFFKKEAEHVEGFAPELAIVTHAGGKKLAEPLVVRPTSETMVHHMFAQWIKSWRDLPLKINQWANVVRWEMRPRAFLRTSEFFWQEGHTAHAGHDDALKTTLEMIEAYRQLAEEYLAIPVLVGLKSEGEKFPGADRTYTFEAFMPDGKALQMGTSHLLSQNFAKAFEMQFQNKDGKLEHPWLTSWGVTTRLVGAVVMTHGDQNGLVLPPKIAPIQVIIVPIAKSDEERAAVLKAANDLKTAAGDIRVDIDTDEHTSPGKKFFHWELKGVPLRVEIGPRDLKNNEAVLADRFGNKETLKLSDIPAQLQPKLDAIQKELYTKAQKRMEAMIVAKETLEDMVEVAQTNVIKTGFCGARECEDSLKKHKLSVRCVMPESKDLKDCFNCKKASSSDCYVARSY